MKKKLIATLSIASLALFAVGCSGATGSGETDLSKINSFTFQNPEYVNAVIKEYGLDDGFALDGELTEDVWESDATAWSYDHYMSSAENPVKMTTKSYYGEKGVYFAFSVTDKAVYYSDDRTASGNTSVELYIAETTTTEWTGNSFRISVVPTGNNECVTEMWTYRPKFAKFKKKGIDTATGEPVYEELVATWRRWYQPHAASCKIRGNGGINTAKNEGYDIEVYIPYESFGMTEKPELMQYMTAFNHVESDSTEAARQWTGCHATTFNNKLGTWLIASNEDVGLYADMSKKLDEKVTVDADITLDGALDEDVWDTENAFLQDAIDSAKGINANLSWMTHFTDKGVYIGTKVDTANIYATSTRDVKYNTGLEFWVQNTAQKSISHDSAHIRVDALGNVVKFKSNLINDWVQNYFPSKSAVKLLGCTENNGVISANNANGFSVETFIPWESLGMNGNANQIAIYPQYVQSLNTDNVTYNKKETDNGVITEMIEPQKTFFGLTGQTYAKEEAQKCFVNFYAEEKIGVKFDGAITQDDNYAGYYSFSTTDANSKNNDGTVYVKDCGDGVAVAVVLESSYINYVSKTTNATTGNNGGGVEIIMTDSTLNNNTNGIIWRVFADGSARCLRDLTQNESAPLQARNYRPQGVTNLYSVGTVANDATDLSKGFKQMTLEFYFPYAMVGVENADDFNIAVALNGTGTNTNATLDKVWSNGETKTQTPTATAYYTISEIIAGPVVFVDGVVDTAYTNSMNYNMAVDGKGSANITVHWLERNNAIYFAFEVKEDVAKKLTNTGSGNQGTAGVNFFVKNVNAETPTGFYYRTYASGIVRLKDFSKFGTDTHYYPGSPMTIGCIKGSETVASGVTVNEITSYVIEYKIPYDSVGATSAEDLAFVFGWISVEPEDYAYDRTNGATVKLSAATHDDLTKESIWYTYAQLNASKVS